MWHHRYSNEAKYITFILYFVAYQIRFIYKDPFIIFDRLTYYPISGLKILIVCFESHLNTEWYRVARTIREMGNQINSTGPTHSHTGLMGHATESEPLWKFLDFIAMHRSPLYTLLLPFIHTRARMPADNEQERTFQLCAKVTKWNDYTMLLFKFVDILKNSRNLLLWYFRKE